MRTLLVAVAIVSSVACHEPAIAQQDRCASGLKPSILLKISGPKNHKGIIRIRLFGGNPETYFDKRYPLEVIQFPVATSSDIERCILVPRARIYAVDVRHDVNGNGQSDRTDGGGASGNPDFSLLDVILTRKPPQKVVQINVARGLTPVAVIIKYLSGTRFKSN